MKHLNELKVSYETHFIFALEELLHISVLVFKLTAHMIYPDVFMNCLEDFINESKNRKTDFLLSRDKIEK